MYLEIDEDFPTHPKTLRLGARLRNPAAAFYMIKLWSWARKFQKDGDITSYDPVELEMAVSWPAADGSLIEAARFAGFIDEVRDGEKVTHRSFHNWMKRTGGAIKRMEAEAERKKWGRLHGSKPRKCGGRPAGCPNCASDEPTTSPVEDGDVRGLSAAAAADIGPTSDVDKTRQGQSKQDPDRSAPIPLLSLPPDRADARSENRAGIWAAADWKRQFEAPWLARYGGLAMGGGVSAAKATGDLADQLAALPEADRVAAQARAPQMFAEFLADESPQLVSARHPWSWFVTRFDGLRVPKAKAAQRREPQRVIGGVRVLG
jgi:hypothetical protein